MNYLNETIDSLNKKLASGEISADQLAKDTVANIKDTDKKLNAWITVEDDAKPAENLDFSLYSISSTLDIFLYLILSVSENLPLPLILIGA